MCTTVGPVACSAIFPALASISDIDISIALCRAEGMVGHREVDTVMSDVEISTGHNRNGMFIGSE